MSSAAAEVRSSGCNSVGHGPFFAPVIADRGAEALIVLVHFPAPPRVGTRFELGGRTWMIVHAKDVLRGFVARPLRRPGRGRR